MRVSELKVVDDLEDVPARGIVLGMKLRLWPGESVQGTGELGFKVVENSVHGKEICLTTKGTLEEW